MTEGARPLTVGIIGAGRRVQNNFLPALRLLGDRAQVAWMHARNAGPLEAAAAPWGVRATTDLDAVLGEVDVVAISVPVDQNANVLRRLLPQAGRLSVVIDTPIANSTRQMVELAGLFARFRRAAPTEDYMNYPPFELMRRIIRERGLGAVRRVDLDGAGYYYHGLALLRSFFDFAPVLSTRREALGGEARRNHFLFSGGREGTISYPYLREAGRTTVTCEKGVITTDPECVATGRRILMSPVVEGGHLAGFRVTEDGQEAVHPLPEIATLLAMLSHDTSDFNMMRTCGLVRIFEDLIAPNLNSDYGVEQAMDDNLVSRRADNRARTRDWAATLGWGTDRQLIRRVAAR